MIRPKRCSRPPGKVGPVTIRLRAPVVTLFVWVAVFSWDSTGVARWGLLAALLHEGGHLAAWVFLVRKPLCLDVTPWGFCLRMRGVCLPVWREKVLAAAGPAVNFLACMAVVWWMGQTRYLYAGYWAASANLLLGCFNLLPIPGLDGARLLQR